MTLLKYGKTDSKNSEPKSNTEEWKESTNRYVGQVNFSGKKNEKDFRQKELDEAEQKGYEAGYAKGIQETEDRFQMEVMFLKNKNQQLSDEQNYLLNRIKQKIDDRILAFNSEFEQSIKVLLTMLLKKILGNEFTLDSKKLFAVVKQSVEEFSKNKKVIVYVNPKHEDAFLKLENNELIIFGTDSALDDFDFYVKQEYARLDGRLETIIKQSIASLM